MVKTIPQVLPASLVDDSKNQASAYKIVDISQLQQGENPGLMVSSKVVHSLDKVSDVPMCFLLVDYKHNFCVTSIYHTSKAITNKIRQGCEVLIKDPNLVLVSLKFKGYQYNYQCLKVTNIS